MSECIVMGFVKFTREEIMQMPKSFRTWFCMNRCCTYISKYRDKFGLIYYILRYRSAGYNVEFMGDTIEEVKTAFIRYINENAETN